MKKIHYQNLGFPRCGTTWLWKSLIKHPEIFKTKNFIKRKNFTYFYKEPKEAIWLEKNYSLPKNLQPMIDTYSEYDISLNFNAFNFKLTELDRIAEYTTHASIFLRNPYEITYSYYNYYNSFSFDRPKISIDDHIKIFNFTDTIKRWSKFKNKFKIFYFDDLVKDSKNFYSTICDFIDIEPIDPIPYKENTLEYILNKNNSKVEEIQFTQEQCQVLNNEIDQLSEFLQKDFSNWKMVN